MLMVDVSVQSLKLRREMALGIKKYHTFILKKAKTKHTKDCYRYILNFQKQMFKNIQISAKELLVPRLRSIFTKQI